VRTVRASSFNGKPKATAWYSSETRLAVKHSRLRLPLSTVAWLALNDFGLPLNDFGGRVRIKP
jgi:hypothetical protein